jgi:hypothetical protein
MVVCTTSVDAGQNDVLDASLAQQEIETVA